MKHYYSYTLVFSLLFLPLFSSCKQKTETTAAKQENGQKAAQKQAPQGMVHVPAGEFIMGTNQTDVDDEAVTAFLFKPWYADEHPERKIFLDGYYMDMYEVTNKDYKQFVDKTKPTYLPYHWKNQSTYPPEIENIPMFFVNWYEAIDFCFFRGKRLPREAEWEKAARGSAGNIYPWGNEFDINKANLAKKSGDVPPLFPVGSFPAGKSPYGVFDMIGNVWEWVYDEYKMYPGGDFEPDEDQKGKRVIRGISMVEVGHYMGDQYLKVAALFARAGYRDTMSPLKRINDIGFRCAKSEKKQ